MALEGSLSDFGLADILQLIYFQRKTGMLTLEGKLDRVKLLFSEGNIVGAESKRRIEDNRLGKILVKKGLISETDLKAALQDHKKSGAKLGSNLLKKNLVTHDALIDILMNQISETVIQLFTWKQGSYEFAAQAVPVDKELGCSLDTQHILMEGLRIVDEWSVIKGKITIDTIFRQTGTETEELTGEENDILSLVNGENDVSAIVDLTGRDNFEVSKTLLSLMERGVIEVVAEIPVEAVTQAEEKIRRPLPVFTLLTPLLLSAAFIVSIGITALSKSSELMDFRAAHRISELRTLIEIYRLNNDALPESLDAISASPDPWGRPYIYKKTASSFTLLSAGPDGAAGTADDIY